MTKKLTILNIILLLLIFLANIGLFYGINYPVRFDFLFHFRNYDFEFIMIVLIILAIPSALISTVEFKNYKFKTKFFGVFALLNTIFLGFIIWQGIEGYNIKKQEYQIVEAEYVRQAKLDIKNDSVTYKYAGGLEVPDYNQVILGKIDSINKNYGVKYFNTGCIIMEQNIKAQEKYAEIVKPYLEKRNGKNWEQKMAKEIERIKRDNN